MRAIMVFAVLLLLIRFGSGSSVTHTALSGVQSTSGNGNLSNLAIGFAMGVLPLIGFIGLFRSFGRWSRRFHGQMKNDGVPLRNRGRGRNR
jgi:hypothetical protein